MKYPRWIDEFAKGAHGLLAGNVLEAWQPLDFYHFFPLWYDLWLERIWQGIQKFNNRKLIIKKNLKIFPTPSDTRNILYRTINTYPHLKKQKEEKFKEVIEFFLKVLRRQCKKDIFAQKSNIVHSVGEIKKILHKIKLEAATYEIASEIGKLNMTLGHLINGLYNDVVTDLAWDIYGPYNVSKYFPPKSILLIRNFFNLRPVELWPQVAEVKNIKHKEIKIYTIYKNINCEIHFVGCHTCFTGPVVENMTKYAVVADGKYKNDLKKIQDLRNYFGSLSIKQWQRLKRLNFEKLKQQVMLQECFQLKNFFEALEMDWRPTKEMQLRIKGKKLLKGLYSFGKIFTWQEFCSQFGIDNLKKMYFKERK